MLPPNPASCQQRSAAGRVRGRDIGSRDHRGCRAQGQPVRKRAAGNREHRIHGQDSARPGGVDRLFTAVAGLAVAARAAGRAADPGPALEPCGETVLAGRGFQPGDRQRWRECRRSAGPGHAAVRRGGADAVHPQRRYRPVSDPALPLRGLPGHAGTVVLLPPRGRGRGHPDHDRANARQRYRHGQSGRTGRLAGPGGGNRLRPVPRCHGGAVGARLPAVLAGRCGAGRALAQWPSGRALAGLVQRRQLDLPVTQCPGPGHRTAPGPTPAAAVGRAGCRRPFAWRGATALARQPTAARGAAGGAGGLAGIGPALADDFG